jgi:hypothetical protein
VFSLSGKPGDAGKGLWNVSYANGRFDVPEPVSTKTIRSVLAEKQEPEDRLSERQEGPRIENNEK